MTNTEEASVTGHLVSKELTILRGPNLSTLAPGSQGSINLNVTGAVL